jgi:hypothetical protein
MCNVCMLTLATAAGALARPERLGKVQSDIHTLALDGFVTCGRVRRA